MLAPKGTDTQPQRIPPQGSTLDARAAGVSHYPAEEELERSTSPPTGAPSVDRRTRARVTVATSHATAQAAVTVATVHASGLSHKDQFEAFTRVGPFLARTNAACPQRSSPCLADSMALLSSHSRLTGEA